MDPRDVTNAEQVRAIVEKRGLNHVKVGVFDIDGILRGKYMARDKFFSALDKGFGFCDVIVCTEFQPCHPVPFFDLRGYHHDRNIFRPRIVLE